MAEVLLVRHAQSFANTRDTAFGNVESPLTDRGIEQATALKTLFETAYDIVPEEYGRPVLASAFLRPRQTAQYAGFKQIDTNPIINESEVPVELLRGNEVIKKHTVERWVPDELRERAKRFIELVRTGEFGYQIYFTHGFFIASVLTELSEQHDASKGVFQHEWDEGRGFIPQLATIIPVSI